MSNKEMSVNRIRPLSSPYFPTIPNEEDFSQLIHIYEPSLERALWQVQLDTDASTRVQSMCCLLLVGWVWGYFEVPTSARVKLVTPLFPFSTL